ECDGNNLNNTCSSTCPGYTAFYGINTSLITTEPYSFSQSLQSLPILSIAADPDKFLQEDSTHHGIYPNANEHQDPIPSSLELIYPDGSSAGFQIGAGLQMHGGASRSRHYTRKLSMDFTFSASAGFGPSKLVFPVFGNDYDSF